MKYDSASEIVGNNISSSIPNWNDLETTFPGVKQIRNTRIKYFYTYGRIHSSH